MRDAEFDIIPTCRELGIKIVAYSPLGRGLLTGTIKGRDDPNLDKSDYRFHSPKFEEENLKKNIKMVEEMNKIAKRLNCT